MDHDDHGHYDRPRPYKYRDELSALRGRFRSISPDEESFSDSDDGKPIRRRARSISSYDPDDSSREADSDDEDGAHLGRGMANKSQKKFSADKPPVAPNYAYRTKIRDAHEVEGRLNSHNGSSSYIEKLERDNTALQQQLRNLTLQTGSLSAPSWSMPGPQLQLDPVNDIDGSMLTPPASTKRDLRPNADLGPSLTIFRVVKQFPAYGAPRILQELDIKDRDQPNNFDHRQLITVIRETDSINRHRYTWIQVFSPVFTRLAKALPNLIGLQNAVDNVLEINEPFVELFHNRRALLDAVKCERLEGFTNLDLLQARRHIRFILDFIGSEFKDISHKLDDLESDRPLNTIKYPELWMLYKPGTIVYSHKDGEYEAFVVEEIRGLQKRRNPRNRSHTHTRLYVICFSIDYDGEIFGRVWSEHCLSPFRGSKQISCLDLIPEKFLPNAAKIKTSLLNRGKTFWDLQGQQYCEHTGKMYSEHTDEEISRVMVDRLTYQRHNNWPISINRKQGPSKTCNKNLLNNRLDQSRGLNEWDAPLHRVARTPFLPPDDAAEWDAEREGMEFEYYEAYQRCMIDRPALSESDNFKYYDVLDFKGESDELTLLLCPQHVHGYCLRDKVWKKLNVNQLHPVTFPKNPWDSLVLDAEYKSIIDAMVSSYISKTSRTNSVVTSKGQGMVAHLCGPSGSGKTLTTECVADAFSKPLYQVACLDLGANTKHFEGRLKETFDYAQTWGAILVLDTADIFLQDPKTTSLEDDTLVSTFLRALDTFSGLCFLTTDRVTNPNQAVLSRIHVTIPVPALDETRRIQVWDIFINGLAAKSTIQPARQELLKQLVRDKWCKQPLNGRQIQNVMRMALVMAENKGCLIGEKEVDALLRIGREFEENVPQEKGNVGALEGFEEVDRP